jgi:hypothetical protein
MSLPSYDPHMVAMTTGNDPSLPDPGVTWVDSPVAVDSQGHASLSGKIPDTVTTDLTEARTVTNHPNGTVKVDY